MDDREYYSLMNRSSSWVNLIRFHAIPDSPLRTSSDGAIAAFQARLQKAGITTTLRASRGEDILAACGLLAGKGLKKNTPNL